MDHTLSLYARWLPIHVHNMVELAEDHPQLHAEFLKGHFVLQKLARKISLKDQAHEHSNKSLQTHGVAVELYKKPEALTLFKLA